MTYNKHKKTYKRSSNRSRMNNRSRMIIGGAWYNPISWFSSSNEQQPASLQQSQQGNSILGTFSNLTNKTEEAFKNVGQGIGNTFSKIMPQKKQTPSQLNSQMPANNMDMAKPVTPMAKPVTPMLPMIQGKNLNEQDLSQAPQEVQMGGMPPSLNLTYPSWAGSTNVAKPTYWVNDYNQRIMGGRRRNKRSNKRSNKRKKCKKCKRTNRRH